jgi:hypothetical protein
MSELAPLVNAQYGVFYVANEDDRSRRWIWSPAYGAEAGTR